MLSTLIDKVVDNYQTKPNQRHYSYADTDAVSGVDVARVLNQNEKQVFKTLVTTGKSGSHYVFLLPVAEELKKSCKECK